jgi:hypothetical protein
MKAYIEAQVVASRAVIAHDQAAFEQRLAELARAKGDEARASEHERLAECNRFLHRALVALYNGNVVSP